MSSFSLLVDQSTNACFFRLKALELVLNGLFEADDIVRQHEVTLNSFDDLPAGLERLRGVHSQLLEMNMVLQQQQSIIVELGTNVGILRQHVARTRFNVSDHPDVDRLEDEVQRITVRWENVCAQVSDRLVLTYTLIVSPLLFTPFQPSD
jgi:hypothetical protein